MTGKLIIFEGINGSGKTTYINEIKKYINCVVLKYPNRNSEKSGEKINKYLKKDIKLNLFDRNILFMNNILEEQDYIKECLNNNINVICDRYYISLIIYQWMEIINSNKTNEYTLNNLLELSNKFIKPDIVFIIEGEHLNLRNEKKEKYHNNNNNYIFNEMITISSLLNLNFNIIDNKNINNFKNNIKIIQELIY